MGSSLLVVLGLFALIVPSTLCVNELSCGHLYYRTMYLDERHNTLFVGAMDRLIRIFPATNVSATDCERDSIFLEATNVASCVSKGKSRDYDCRNHIRVIEPIGDGSRLYICGTNAHSPKDIVIYANLTKLARHEFYPGIGEGIAKCPFDPEDNSTATWVETGNLGGHPAIYSGTNAEFTKADSVIFRGNIFDPNTGRQLYPFKRTVKYDSLLLDKPDFVGSYDIGEHVYFFFREMAVEYMNCGKIVYSRVARVCKKDMGGKNVLNQNWVTYLKARLNCSIPGDFPFFFNEIQDVYKAPYDDTTFHTVFTTNSNGLSGSAICTFRLQDIRKVFEGKFKEQTSSTSMWLPVPSASVPEPRPGTCVPDTRELPDTVLNFIRSHSLMDSDVPHDSEGPAFYKRGVIFTKLAVDQVTIRGPQFGSSTTYTIYFAGSSDGYIYKVARWIVESADSGSNQQHKSRLLDVFPVTVPEAVRALAISREHKTLFVTSDTKIVQLEINQCQERYKNCLECVRDPYCGWNKESGLCQVNAPHLLQDPSGLVEGMCEGSLPSMKVSASFGQSIHLSCQLSKSIGSREPVDWFHYSLNGKRRHLGGQESEKYVFTHDHGLVVIGVSEHEAGRYDCRIGRETVTKYQVTVDLQQCSAPNKTTDYQKIYSDWCQEYQKYKMALKTWEKRRSQCAALPHLPDLDGRSVASFDPASSIYETNPLL